MTQNSNFIENHNGLSVIRYKVTELLNKEIGPIYRGIEKSGPDIGIAIDEFKKVPAKIIGARLVWETWNNDHNYSSNKPQITLEFYLTSYQRPKFSRDYGFLFNDWASIFYDYGAEKLIGSPEKLNQCKEDEFRAYNVQNNNGIVKRKFRLQKELTSFFAKKKVDLFIADIRNPTMDKRIYILGLRPRLEDRIIE